MIRTISDLLNALLEKHRESIPGYEKIQHPGMYGEIYEGLTKSIIAKSIFQGLDIKVRSGKIRNSKGNLSRQIDCMVVRGEGEHIPFTQNFIYQLNDVVMIVEVKKNLYGVGLCEAMELFHQFWSEVSEARKPQTGLVGDAWKSLFKQNLPELNDLDKLPYHEQMIYHSLIVESAMPLRVIIGYEGYSDEYALREGLINYIETICDGKVHDRPRFNINTIPNLIICKKASLIKLDGMPYCGFMESDGYMGWIASRRSEPIHALLELLWTRLAYLYKLSPRIFGEDLELEVAHPLLSVRAVKIDLKGGWEYRSTCIHKKDLAAGNEREDWHPFTLNEIEFTIMNILSLEEEIDITDKSFINYIKSKGETTESICASLNTKRLVVLVGSKLKLLTDECICMILPDGRYIAGENKSDRLINYALKFTKEYRLKNDSIA